MKEIQISIGGQRSLVFAEDRIDRKKSLGWIRQVGGNISVLEVWSVKYVNSGEEKSKSFNWSNFNDLKRFVLEHEVTEVVFKATGLPESQVRAINTKNIYEVTVPKAEVVNLSHAWVEQQRKGY